MKLKLRFISLMLLTLAMKLSAQDTIFCARDRMKDFVLDGQEYHLVLKGSDRGKIFFSFFDAFEYRIAFCSNTSKKYKIDLYDIQKKLLFSGSCKDFTKILDVSFKSNIAGYIEIICENQGNIDPVFQILIGFKELKDQKIISKE